MEIWAAEYFPQGSSLCFCEPRGEAESTVEWVRVGWKGPDYTFHFHLSRANLLLSSKSETPLWDETEIELWKTSTEEPQITREFMFKYQALAF